MPASPVRHQAKSRQETAKVARLTSSAHHFCARAPGNSMRTSAPARGRKVMIESSGTFDGFILPHHEPDQQRDHAEQDRQRVQPQ